MHRQNRVNASLELAVRLGIVLDFEFGAVTAWAFMQSNGVSESVIMRVLVEGEKRRDADLIVLGIAQRTKGRIQRETMQAVFNIENHRTAA
jgi:hypothetical protein